MMPTYLDWAATTPADPELMKAALSVSLEAYGNPSSNHFLGKQAIELLEDSRCRIMRALGLNRGNFIFTGSGSEADQIPLLATVQKLKKKSGASKSFHMVISSIEHAAIENQVKVLEKMGIDISWIQANAYGFIAPEKISAHIRKETALVAVMNVNNETGAIQDTFSIAESISQGAAIAGIPKPWFHVDAVQSLGKLPIGEISLYADSIALSAHKICGPKGVGGLWLSKALVALASGGGQEFGIRAGTENLFGAIAFCKVAEKAINKEQQNGLIAHRLESRVIEGISHIKGAIIVPERRPSDAHYVPNIISIAFPGVGGETMVRALSDQGIAISTGSACSSNKAHRGRRVLEAMGISEEIAMSTIRLSTGPSTTSDEIDNFLEHSEDLYRILKN
jgi:cysteine desulfurase